MESSLSQAANHRETLGFVIPLFNEEAAVPGLVRSIEAFRQDHHYLTQIVLVDDGSRDGTANRIRELTEGLPGYVLVQFSRNFGHQLAITAGLHSVSTDAAIVLDADLQDPLSVVDRMVEKWREGYDVVYGVRKHREGDSWIVRSLSAVFYRVFQRLSDSTAPIDVGDFRLISRDVIEAFRQLEERQPYVRGLISWLGFNQTGVEYDRTPRTAGKSKYSMGRRFNFAFNSLIAFSDKPLRYAAKFGLIVSVISIAGLVWTILVRLLDTGVVSGWASLIFTAFFFGGLQLFFLGVVGAYLARVYDEVKSRPRFIVSRKWTSERSAEVDDVGEELEEPLPRH